MEPMKQEEQNSLRPLTREDKRFAYLTAILAVVLMLCAPSLVALVPVSPETMAPAQVLPTWQQEISTVQAKVGLFTAPY